MIIRRSPLLLLALVAAIATVASVYAVPPSQRPPVIGTPAISPASPGSGDTVTVSVNVTDTTSGVKNVTIVYTTNNWQSNASVAMAYNATISDLATGQIPSLAMGGHVSYYLVAFDYDGNKAVNDNNGAYFGYDVSGALGPATVSTLVYIGVLGAVGAGVAAMAYMFLRKPASSSSQTTSRTSRDQ